MLPPRRDLLISRLSLAPPLSQYSPVEGVVLKLHMGVGAGELSEFYVGGHGGKWEYFVAGQPIEQISEATEAAAHGQLVLSKQAHEALQGDAEARAKLNLHGRQLPSEQYLLDELLETSRSRKRRWSNSHRRVRAAPPALVSFAPAPRAYSDLFQPPLCSLIHQQYHPSPIVISALSSSPPHSRPPPLLNRPSSQPPPSPPSLPSLTLRMLPHLSLSLTLRFVLLPLSSPSIPSVTCLPLLPVPPPPAPHLLTSLHKFPPSSVSPTLKSSSSPHPTTAPYPLTRAHPAPLGSQMPSLDRSLHWQLLPNSVLHRLTTKEVPSLC